MQQRVQGHAPQDRPSEVRIGRIRKYSALDFPSMFAGVEVAVCVRGMCAQIFCVRVFFIW